MRNIIWVGLLAMGVAGCGASESGNGTAGADSGSQGAAATAAAPAAQVDDSRFDARVYSYREAMDASVFGLKFDMTIDEVRAALTEQGFDIPDDYADRGDPRVRGNSLDLGMGPRATIEPGARQQMNYNWFRFPEGGDIDMPSHLRPAATETLAPWFYVDQQGVQRLYAVQYKRGFDPSVDPRGFAATLVERFGEPSRMTESPANVRADYILQLPVPAGYRPDAVDDREDHDLERQRPVQTTRYACLSAMQRDVTAPVSSECRAVMNGDADAQRLFDSVNSRGNGRFYSRFLNFQVLENRMTLEFRAEWLPSVVIGRQNDARMLAEIEARKARADRPAAAPKGL